MSQPLISRILYLRALAFAAIISGAAEILVHYMFQDPLLQLGVAVVASFFLIVHAIDIRKSSGSWTFVAIFVGLGIVMGILLVGVIPILWLLPGTPLPW